MVDQPQANSAPLWKVGVPVQTTIPDRNKGYVPAWEIPVIMANGGTFTVTIPATDFNPDSVRALIEDHVNRYVGVATLEGPTY